jgi:malate dehydrogenase
MKITIIGAGAVGATTADNLVRRNIAEEIVLLDIKEGVAEGKAQDMMQTAALLGFESSVKGVTNDYIPQIQQWRLLLLEFPENPE